MRNLEILTRFADTLSSYLQQGERVERACFDEFGRTCVVYTSGQRMLVFHYGSEQDPAEFKLESLIEMGDENPNLADSYLVQMNYIQGYQGVMFTYACGNMYIYRPWRDDQEAKIEEVGEITDGIMAAAWSPNQEYLAVTTRQNLLILFSPEFEICSESPIDDNDMTFHDLQEGDKPNPVVQDAAISWRGDSTIFVVNYAINGGRKCLTRDVQSQLKVSKGPARADYQVVFSVSEKPVPIELPVCFMPNGSLVAGFQNRKLPNGQIQPEIIFWERNGLRHGEFVLPYKPQDAVKVIGLEFNAETTMLAIHIQVNGQEQILIFTRSNWKWFQKQAIPVGDEQIAYMGWLKKQQMVVVLKTGLVYFFEYGFTYTSSMSVYNGGDDLAYTLVVNGAGLMLTPLGKMMMPPPMCEKEIILDSIPQCVSMFCHKVTAVTSQGSLYHFDAGLASAAVGVQSLANGFANVTSIQNFNYKDCEYVILVTSANHQDKFQVYKIDGGQALLHCSKDLDFKIQKMSLCANLTTSSAFKSSTFQSQNSYYRLLDGWSSEEEAPVSVVVQSTTKQVFRIEMSLTENKLHSPELLFTLEHLALSLKACFLSGQEAVVIMTSNLRLYINDKVFSNECTSMAITQNFLLFVNTTSGLMHEMLLFDLNRPLPQPSQQKDESQFNVRAVERGARIVCSCGTKLVLQMPRGNLEGIQPRIMVLKEVIQLVNNLEYGKAFRILRQHKIDINLIYDVNPEQFLANIEKFVKEVSQVDYLNLFINSLSKESRGKELDFMLPLSKEDLVRREHELIIQKFAFTKAAQTDKINTICDALKQALEKVNPNNKYLLPILTTYIKRDPQELKQVLIKIQDMQKHEQENNLHSRVVPPHLNPQTMQRDIDQTALKLGSKEALEYVSWLVQPDRLFDVALTTYDFDLVCLVASQTQKDPKEYVPYLQELKTLPEAYRHFKIHFDLKQFELALECLSKSDSDDHFIEAVSLIKKQRLFKKALLCYDGDQSRLAVVRHAFGEYLEQRGYADEAGFMFLQAARFDDAIEAFKKALNVPMVHTVASRQNLGKQEMQKLNVELVELLRNSNRFEEAASLIDPFSDFELALDCLLRSNNYDKAIQICAKTNNDARINTTVKSALLVACDLKSNQLKSVLDQFSKRLLRLRILQQNKKSMPQNERAGNFELDSEQLSVSQASQSQRSQSSRGNRSQASGFSETSKRSRKLQVKAMKKKKDCKEGSPFEEENLIELLKEETKLEASDKSQVKILMQALTYFGMLEESIQIHELVAKVIKAGFEADQLLSLEQEVIYEKQPELKLIFEKELGRQPKELIIKKTSEEWENQKCFKH